MNAPELYEIYVEGHISDLLGSQFDGLSLLRKPDGNTTLSGNLDQSALHGILMKIRNLGLKLISVNKVDQNNE